VIVLLRRPQANQRQLGLPSRHCAVDSLRDLQVLSQRGLPVVAESCIAYFHDFLRFSRDVSFYICVGVSLSWFTVEPFLAGMVWARVLNDHSSRDLALLQATLLQTTFSQLVLRRDDSS